MAKTYTWDDVPNTLNSISWQLKCIAETLAEINARQQGTTKVQEPTQPAEQPTKPSRMRKLLSADDLGI